MTQETFEKLVDFVQSTSANPPDHLFAQGVEDWHARARLAHFLCMEGIDKNQEAIKGTDQSSE